MVATFVNAIVLHDALEQSGLHASVYSALPMPPTAPAFDPATCRADLAAGRIAILAGGTGNPLFTTDSAAALRGVQLEAQIVLKATRVDGVYSGDPEKDPNAKFLAHLSYAEVLERRLGVMDLGAIALCMEHNLPVRVFNYGVAGNIRRALAGELIGTLIGNADHGR
jgi:uridylate kinase